MRLPILLLLLVFSCCKESDKQLPVVAEIPSTNVRYAKGFSLHKERDGLIVLSISSPWPNAEKNYTYALVDKEKLPVISLKRDAYDAIIGVPVEGYITTSTTHIPALETLGVIDKLQGFPDTEYISSLNTRRRIEQGHIKDIGSNESLNTEMAIALQPEVVFGFSISSENRVYEVLKIAGIPTVYNGDWTEDSPLGKAEWIKFFAPFFGKEKEADTWFRNIEKNYLSAKKLAKEAKSRPTVLSGALYKDVWYLPGGNSWAATFLEDANAAYLWSETSEKGSLSLSVETVLDKAKEAEYWVSPSQFISYQELENANRHYRQFKAFKNKKVFTFARSKGPTGGLLYYELAPGRPDEVLKDLIAIFHPELLPERENIFFKPLE